MPDDRPPRESGAPDDRRTRRARRPAPNDSALIAALRSGTPKRREAAARRVPLSSRVAEVLVATGEPEVVAAVLANRTAVIAERLLLDCLDRLADDDRVQTAMIRRDRLPPAVAQRLAALASGRLGAELLARHALPPLPESEPGELGPSRPEWWPRHIAGPFR